MDLPVPTHIQTALQAREKMLKDYDEALKLENRYTTLRRRLEVCREAKPVARENLEAQRAVQYHQSIQQQIQKKLDDVIDSMDKMKRKYEIDQEKYMTNYEMEQEKLKKKYETDQERLKTNYEADLARLTRHFTENNSQDELRKSKLVDNMTYVENRLKTAQERATRGQRDNTKEEISLLKEIDELITKYREVQPTANLDIVFPDYKTLRNPLNPPTPAPQTNSMPTPKPPPQTNPLHSPLPPTLEKPQEEENPVAKLSDKQINKMDDEKLFALLRPDVKNPYGNVITNTKQKRPSKKVSQ